MADSPFFGAVTDAARITISKKLLRGCLHEQRDRLRHPIPLLQEVAAVPLRFPLDRKSYILFGLTGTLAETKIFRSPEFQSGQDVGVCPWADGVPSLSARYPRNRRTRPTRWWTWLIAIFLPPRLQYPIR